MSKLITGRANGTSLISLDPWFPTVSDFVPLPPAHKGTLGMFWDIFDCHDWGEGCQWHLVGRSQDAAKPPYNAEDRLYHEEEASNSKYQ